MFPPVAFAPLPEISRLCFRALCSVPLISLFSPVPHTVSIPVALRKASLSPSRIALALLGLSPLFISEICQPAGCLSPQVLQGAETTFQMGGWCGRDRPSHTCSAGVAGTGLASLVQAPQLLRHTEPSRPPSTSAWNRVPRPAAPFWRVHLATRDPPLPPAK